MSNKHIHHQQIEITHDILAKKIYARIDADEKMRLKITQMLKERYANHEETGLLTKKELAYIDPYLGQVQPNEDQQTFIRKSRAAVKADENRRRLIIGVVGAVLIAATSISIWFGLDAQNQANIAEAKTEEAIKSDSLAQIEKDNALKAKVIADSSARAAKISDSLAQIEKKNAEKALTNLENATESIVKAVLEDAKQDIYKLRYEEALQKYQNAYKLQKLPWEVAKGMMELAFFYGESGEIEQAYGLAHTVASLLGKSRGGTKSHEGF